MATDIRFYVDEDTLHLGKALAAVQDDVVHPGHVHCPIPRGALDSQWLPIVGERDWPLISRDKRLRTKPAEKIKLIVAVADRSDPTTLTARSCPRRSRVRSSLHWRTQLVTGRGDVVTSSWCLGGPSASSRSAR